MARTQITLAPGDNTILHGLAGFTSPAEIMVIPAIPFADWFHVDIVGQPGPISVTLNNSLSLPIVLNVIFEYPHSIIGAAILDDYA